jgi:hypothetical protein
VVLIDGAGPDTAQTMATWDGLCRRGLDLVVDVGFPTVSLPVELALWSGLTQQQTGVLYHATGTPVTPPPGAIPAAVPDSIAVAESHAYIIHSLGFARTEPPTPAKELPPGWAERWVDVAVAAVAEPARLVFVHILRVDTIGHKHGKRSAEWREAAASSDAILARLVAADPDARWLVLADHDHLATGGHGSEDHAIRLVRGCLAGPGIEPGRGGPIHVVDVARAIADSVGVALPAASAGRPLTAALAAPVDDDDVLPRLPRDRVALAIAVLLLAIVATGWGMAGRVDRRPVVVAAGPGALDGPRDHAVVVDADDLQEAGPDHGDADQGGAGGPGGGDDPRGPPRLATRGGRAARAADRRGPGGVDRHRRDRVALRRPRLPGGADLDRVVAAADPHRGAGDGGRWACRSRQRRPAVVRSIDTGGNQP